MKTVNGLKQPKVKSLDFIHFMAAVLGGSVVKALAGLTGKMPEMKQRNVHSPGLSYFRNNTTYKRMQIIIVSQDVILTLGCSERKGYYILGSWSTTDAKLCTGVPLGIESL